MVASGARAKQGSYQPLLELASGGMATVHVARHVGVAGFERLVVLKRVHKKFLEDRAFYTMLVDEARVASLIRHPNVVPVIDVVEDKGELLLVLEYVESMSLAALLGAARSAKEPLPVPVVARIVADCLAGLHAAHEAIDIQGRPLEVVHRDVTPQNVIVSVDGTSRLIDFGVAKAARRLTATTGGVIKGKTHFMSPEQLKQQALDRRSDVFAAGVVLYVALTGRMPFLAEDEADLLLALLVGEVPLPSSIVPELPPKLDAVIQYALAPHRDERFQTAAAFMQALETAVPPAAAREVARYVERYGGAELTARRDTLRAILAGASVESAAAPKADVGTLATETLAVPARARRAKGPDALDTERTLHSEGVGVVGRTQHSEGVSVVEPAPIARSRTRLPLGIALAAITLLAAAATTALLARPRGASVPEVAPVASEPLSGSAYPTADVSVVAAPRETPPAVSLDAPEPPPTTSAARPKAAHPPRPPSAPTERPAPAPTSTELRGNPYGTP